MGYKPSGLDVALGVAGMLLVGAAMKPKKKRRKTSSAAAVTSGKIGSQLTKIKPNVRFGVGGSFKYEEILLGFTAVFFIYVKGVTAATKSFWKGVGDLAPDIGFEIIDYTKVDPSYTDLPYLGVQQPNKFGQVTGSGDLIDSAVQHLDQDGVPRGSNVDPFVKKLASAIEGAREKYKRQLS